MRNRNFKVMVVSWTCERMVTKKVFVTVGTTKFDSLIEEISSDNILNILETLGYEFVQFQVGTSCVKEKKSKNLKLQYDSYFENFAEVIKESDLVISHAGAGTCLEVLKQKKPLIVVINEELMDNHQIELAEELAKNGYLQFCTTRTLRDVLLENKFTKFKEYPNTDPNLFANYLNKSMGFN